VKIAEKILKLLWAIRVSFYAARVAAQVLPQLKRAVARKLTTHQSTSHGARSPQSSQNVTLYSRTRAAQLAQPIVDELMRANPRIPAVLGNKIVVGAANRAASRACSSAHRRAA